MKRRDVLKLLPALGLPMAFSLHSRAGHAASSGPVANAKIGMNLAPVTYWSTEHPFCNLAMSASRWRLQEINGPFSWDLPLPPSSPDGYPLVVPPGTFLESFLIFTPFRGHLPEQLTVAYEGQGVIDYLAGGELIRRRQRADVIRNLRSDAPIIARLVSTSQKNPLRNIRVDDGSNGQGALFRPAFLERLTGMSVLRFMDWMDTNNSKVSRWEQRPRADRYCQTEGGVALELMVALCNRLSIAPWFTLPHLADDDFVRRFAEQVRDTLDPSIPVYVEYSNEVWNALFEQARYARSEGMRLGLSSNEYEAGLRYYSERTSQVLSIWENTFGADNKRVVGVYAAQAVTPWTSEVVLSWGDAAKHADVLAVAPYFGGAMGDAEHAPKTAGWTLDQLFEALAEEVDGINRDFIRDQAAMAQRFGVRMVAYEGGQHLVGYSGTPHDEKLHGLFAEANRDARMGDLYRKHLAHWVEAGGGTYVFFNSMGPCSKWGCWGLLEHEAERTSPKWQAVREMIGA